MKIDLHGYKHEEVERLLDMFLWDMMCKKVDQIEIVTGISDRMKSIVKSTCDEYGFSIVEKFYNPGSLIIDMYN